MPKLKTNRAARKRFRMTKSGKIKRGRSMHRHILTSKRMDRKRRLRTASYVHPADEKAIRALLPYG